MSTKRQFAEVIASLPESASVEEAFERLYLAFKEKHRRDSVLRTLRAAESAMANRGQPGPAAHETREPRRPGVATGAVTDAFFEPLPEEELQAWES